MTRLHKLDTLAYPALLLAILIAFYWKITLTYEYDWVSGPRLAQQILPWFDEQARQLQHGHIPTWDPHTWAGQPFFGEAYAGAAYPLNWLLFLFPRKHGHIDTLALQWYFVAMHYMAALFCYLLCRDLGLTRFASLAGGLIFSLGATLGTMNVPQVINSAVWAPLIFLFLLRATRGVRPLASAALCGLFSGMSWLSGDYEVPLFLSLAAGFTWLYYVFRVRTRRLAGLAVIALVFAFLTSALQVLPAWQYSSLAKQQPATYTVQESFSTPPITLIGTVIPGINEYAGPFIGVAAFVLSATGVLTAWSRAEVKLFTALAAAGFAYALGFHNVFQGMLYAIFPLVHSARTPVLALAIFGFGAAVLAAFGTDQLRSLRGSGFLRVVTLGLAAFGLLIWFVAYCVLLAKALEWAGDDRVMMTGLVAVLAAGLLAMWQRGHATDRTAAVFLTGLLLIELGNVAGDSFVDRNNYTQSLPLEAVRANADVANFLNSQPPPFRVDVESNEIPVNWTEYNNFDHMRSEMPSLTRNLAPLDAATPQVRSLFGVQFLVGRETSMPDAEAIFQNAEGLKIFRNPHAFPRAWAVHETVVMPRLENGQEMIRDHVEDLRRKALVPATEAGLETCATGDSVTVTRHDPSRVTIAAKMACAGMVVLSDTYYPGWTATVDSKPVQIRQVNFAMRGVQVARGAHEINYRYRPGSVYAGAGATAVGVLGACLLVFFDPARRHAVDLGAKRANNQS